MMSASHKEVKVWDLEGQDEWYDGHADQITAICPVGDNKAISASLDGTVRLWDTAVCASERISKYRHDDGMLNMATTSEGRWAVSWAHSDEGVQVFDLESGRTTVFAGPNRGTDSLKISPDGRHAVWWVRTITR